MLAIHTKFVGPTNTKGARVKAYVSGPNGTRKSVIVSYNHGLDTVGSHFEAVKALAKKYGTQWNLNDMRYGDSADNLGFCFCFEASKIDNARLGVK